MSKKSSRPPTEFSTKNMISEDESILKKMVLFKLLGSLTVADWIILCSAMAAIFSAGVFFDKTSQEKLLSQKDKTISNLQSAVNLYKATIDSIKFIDRQGVRFDSNSIHDSGTGDHGNIIGNDNDINSNRTKPKTNDPKKKKQ